MHWLCKHSQSHSISSGSDEVNLRTSAVVLAAGRSSRMGRNKLLLKIDGVTILDRLLSILNSVLDNIILVTGYDPDPIKKIAKGYNVKIVHNPDFDKGMTTSFKAGLRVIDTDAVFLILGDQLGLEMSLLRRMISAMEDSNALIVSPKYKDKKGHPTLFRRPIFDELLSLGDSDIIRDVVLRHEAEQITVEGTEWTTLDFDTQNDFKIAKKFWEKM